MDGKLIAVSDMAAHASGQNEVRRVSTCRVTYARDAHSRTLTPRVNVSNVRLDRHTETIFGTSGGTRSVTFPGTVRTV